MERNVSLRPYTTLRAGGPAEVFERASTVDDLAGLCETAQQTAIPVTILGWGSNVLPSDAGVPGLVVLNTASSIHVESGGILEADTGCAFQDVFLCAAQHGLGGLEFAVGIPGTLGGALVSNAGAYRSNISEFLTGVEVVYEGKRMWVDPEWMQFSYRDSRLRRDLGVQAALLRVRMTLPSRSSMAIYQEARDYQRQRISKQPPPASAGSFFKNVVDAELAAKLPGLTDGMRKAGVVPAGFLIEAAGLKGFRKGGAMFGARHANFILNVGGASASEIRRLAEHGKAVVQSQFGVVLEEEALYLGDWSGWPSA